MSRTCAHEHLKFMAHVQSFRELRIWQLGMELVRAAYKISRCLPAEDTYELGSQLRRAALSIPLNIAEGFGKQNRADFASFLRIARGSANELETILEIVRTRHVIDDRFMLDTINLCVHTRVLLIRFIKRMNATPQVKKKKSEQPSE